MRGKESEGIRLQKPRRRPETATRETWKEDKENNEYNRQSAKENGSMEAKEKKRRK